MPLPTKKNCTTIMDIFAKRTSLFCLRFLLIESNCLARVLINPPQFCFVLSRRSRQVPAFYILWSLTCFVIILAFFPTIFQLELWPLGLLSNYLYHFFLNLFMQQSNLQNSMLCVILENDRVGAKYWSVNLMWSFKLYFI